MRRFTQLFRDLDERSRQGDKLALLEAYFGEVPAQDAAWCLWFLWGHRLNTGISPRRLNQWAGEITGYPEWLQQSCHSVVGDLGEASALLLPPADPGGELSLSELVEQHLQL